MLVHEVVDTLVYHPIFVAGDCVGVAYRDIGVISRQKVRAAKLFLHIRIYFVPFPLSKNSFPVCTK